MVRQGSDLHRWKRKPLGDTGDAFLGQVGHRSVTDLVEIRNGVATSSDRHHPSYAAMHGKSGEKSKQICTFFNSCHLKSIKSGSKSRVRFLEEALAEALCPSTSTHNKGVLGG